MASPTRSGGDGGWPISYRDVLQSRDRIRPHLPKTPLRAYPTLDAEVGRDIKVFVKHENHNPTNSFKARNGLSLMSALSADERQRGVVAATRGNHGLGLAWAGRLLGAKVTVCVPRGNNPEKNEAMRGFGVELIEEGRDYDEVVRVAERLVRERGVRLAHSTNDPLVIAGAATLTLEILEENPGIEALVIGVGGGSQAVGALTVARELRPDLTFPALRQGLAGFVTASEGEIAEALRLLLRVTHNLAEGAGAAGLAGLLKLRDTLAGRTVGIVLSGSNIDAVALRRVLNGEI